MTRARIPWHLSDCLGEGQKSGNELGGRFVRAGPRKKSNCTEKCHI